MLRILVAIVFVKSGGDIVNAIAVGSTADVESCQQLGAEVIAARADDIAALVADGIKVKVLCTDASATRDKDETNSPLINPEQLGKPRTGM